jgi:hypothetical protein
MVGVTTKRVRRIRAPPAMLGGDRAPNRRGIATRVPQPFDGGRSARA